MTAQVHAVMKQALEALEAMKAEFRAYDLPYGSKAYTQGNEASHILRDALSEPEPMQEPIEYQHRSRPPWETVWGGWFKCSKADAERYVKSPRIDDYFHEVRELYTATPQQDEPMHLMYIGLCDAIGYSARSDELQSPEEWAAQLYAHYASTTPTAELGKMMP